MIVRNSIREMGVRGQRKGQYDGGSFILLDEDRYVSDGNADAIQAVIKKRKIHLVLLRPNLECFLGRLISGQFDLGDARADAALKSLWPDYEKDFDALTLKGKLTADRLRESQAVGREWKSFLDVIGFL